MLLYNNFYFFLIDSCIIWSQKSNKQIGVIQHVNSKQKVIFPSFCWSKEALWIILKLDSMEGTALPKQNKNWHSLNF